MGAAVRSPARTSANGDQSELLLFVKQPTQTNDGRCGVALKDEEVHDNSIELLGGEGARRSLQLGAPLCRRERHCASE